MICHNTQDKLRFNFVIGASFFKLAKGLVEKYSMKPSDDSEDDKIWLTTFHVHSTSYDVMLRVAIGGIKKGLESGQRYSMGVSEKDDI